MSALDQSFDVEINLSQYNKRVISSFSYTMITKEVFVSLAFISQPHEEKGDGIKVRLSGH